MISTVTISNLYWSVSQVSQLHYRKFCEQYSEKCKKKKTYVLPAILSISEIDIILGTISYQGIPIARDRPGNYSFQLQVNNTGGGLYDVVSLQKGATNFKAFYFYSNENWNINKYNLSHFNLFNAYMDMSDAATSINKGSSKVLTAYVSDGMNYTDCYNITHLCFALFNGARASFVDLNVQNSVKCFLLSSTKDCEPGKRSLC